MTFYFLDSSAFSKLFLAEGGSSSLKAFLRNVESENIVICSIARLEVCSAIHRRVFLRQLSMTERDQQLILLEHSLDLIGQIPMETWTIDRATILIMRHRLRSLDAIQLACASLLSEELGEGDSLLFIASDHRLLDAAQAEKLSIWDPSDAAAVPEAVVPVN